MFDFAGTLREAEDAVTNEQYVIAIWKFWQIGYYFQEEEFPYGYTHEIGARASESFLKYMKLHKKKILKDEVYLRMKEELKDFKSFQNFERVVNSFFYTKRKPHFEDKHQDEYHSEIDIW